MDISPFSSPSVENNFDLEFEAYWTLEALRIKVKTKDKIVLQEYQKEAVRVIICRCIKQRDKISGIILSHEV